MNISEQGHRRSLLPTNPQPTPEPPMQDPPPPPDQPVDPPVYPEHDQDISISARTPRPLPAGGVVFEESLHHPQGAQVVRIGTEVKA